MYIGSDEVRTGNTRNMTPPHDHQHVVGQYHLGEQVHAENAISEALEARKQWSQMPWEQRAAIFLRAAELVAGP